MVPAAPGSGAGLSASDVSVSGSSAGGSVRLGWSDGVMNALRWASDRITSPRPPPAAHVGVPFNTVHWNLFYRASGLTPADTRSQGQPGATGVTRKCNNPGNPKVL